KDTCGRLHGIGWCMSTRSRRVHTAYDPAIVGMFQGTYILIGHIDDDDMSEGSSIADGFHIALGDIPLTFKICQSLYLDHSQGVGRKILDQRAIPCIDRREFCLSLFIKGSRLI